MPADTTMMYFHAASMLSGAALEGDEKRADQRRQLDGDPIDADVVHQRRDQRGQAQIPRTARRNRGDDRSSPSSRM